MLTFRRMGSERGYDDDLDGVLQFLFTRKCSLYAVFQSSQPKLFNFVPVGDYSVVFVADEGFPARYEVTGGRIVGMWMGQSGDLALQRMLADANGVFVVPPPTVGG